MIRVLFSFLLLSSIIVYPQSKVNLNEWLVAGPVRLFLPYNTGGAAAGVKDLVAFDQMDVTDFQPVINEKLEWGNNNVIVWQKGNYNNEKLMFSPAAEDGFELFYAVSYITAERWLKGNLEIKSCYPVKIYLNGTEILSKDNSKKGKENEECEGELLQKEIKLEKGLHTLIVKVINDPSVNGEPAIDASLNLNPPFTTEELRISAQPVNSVSIKNLLDDPKITSASISPDGELVAVTMSQIIKGSDKSESWIDIIKVSDGANVRSFKGGMKVSSVNWGGAKDIFAYTVKEKEETDLWMHNLSNGSTVKLLDRVKNFGSFKWSPDGSFIIYSVTEKPSDNTTGLYKINEMQERLPDSKNKSSLYLLNVKSGMKMRLTTGEKSANLIEIRGDGKKFLYTLAGIDLNTRPYHYSTYYLYDLETFSSDSLFSGFWSGAAQFSPDFKRLIITGGPTLFGETGVNVSEGLIPNEYDTQAYLYDLENKSITTLTKDFDPSVRSVYWSKEFKTLYFDVNESAGNSLYRYNWTTKGFTPLKINTYVVNGISFAERKPVAIYYGSGEVTPSQLYAIDLNSGKSKLLVDPNRKSFRNIKLGEAKPFIYKNERGVDIEGTVYYPPGFDSNRKYPLIVYYYGGTTPVSLEFEGRYPKNIWAANGYVIYIIQPSGAIGYGQNFSALHVNDWGEITANEIINGTKAFIEAHPFVDEKRIGCIGASYGGFMTMDILTKTDLFAAAVSHAGISSLSSYWGEGYWGYTYSAVATANSFPWNRKDIYVERSPLFKADKITTPLLLLHGDADTNVPPGESDQMFTSLKLLGKEVDYIKVANQDHHILDYGKRKLWTKTIIAWFDRYLKNQPEWYDDLYPRK
jgi:dipeptidyl aminopeptidase/acylaminoacyl peptidase